MANREFKFTDEVKSGCKIMAVLLGLLIVTLPFAIWFWRKSSRGNLQLDDDHCTVCGLGLGTVVLQYANIKRIGVLRVSLPKAGIGGVIAKKMSGGSTAVNLCTVDGQGKTKRFMVSRFTDSDAILSHFTERTGLPLETVSRGVSGPKWPATSPG